MLKYIVIEIEKKNIYIILEYISTFLVNNKNQKNLD